MSDLTPPLIPTQDDPPQERAANRNAWAAYALAAGGVLTSAAAMAKDGQISLEEWLLLGGMALTALGTAFAGRSGVMARQSAGTVLETLGKAVVDLQGRQDPPTRSRPPHDSLPPLRREGEG